MVVFSLPDPSWKDDIIVNMRPGKNMGLLFGVTIEPLEFDDQPGRQSLHALLYHDHWLRRFGLAELIELDGEAAASLQLRQSADEIWILFTGTATLRMIDRRPDSPSYDQSHEVELQAPVRVLIPFGVAAGLRIIAEPVRLLRLATHSEEESPIQHLDWEAA
jgi:hypothetical protein